MKRVFDVFFSLIVIILILSWLVPLVVVITYLETRENVFFLQERIGRNGKIFHILKFRSMEGKVPHNDPILSYEEASRITVFGGFMRKYRIDEFPQFINVVKGQMSIVGPRPERQFFLDQIISFYPKYRELQKLRPGITSIGQIKYGYADDIVQMKKRARYDLLYLDNISLHTDLKVIFTTILIVFKGKGR